MSEQVNERNEKGGTFRCGVCGLTEAFHYYGARPPFHRALTFLEEGYIMKDPFTSQSNRSFLFLGGSCVACGVVVCQGCSVFYTKRFCHGCAAANAQEFPQEMHKRIAK